MENANSFVFVAVFDNENGARAAMKELKKARGAQTGPIKKAASLRCSGGRLLHFSDVYDRRSSMEAVLGCLIGGFLGLLNGTIIVPLATGVVIGALAAKLRASGFTEGNLTPLVKTLNPGKSLMVAEIEPGSVSEVEWLLQQAGATVSIHEVRSEVVTSLEACSDLKLTPGPSVKGLSYLETIVNS